MPFLKLVLSVLGVALDGSARRLSDDASDGVSLKACLSFTTSETCPLGKCFWDGSACQAALQWVQGSPGDSCTTTCTADSLVCEEKWWPSILSDFDSITSAFNYSLCSSIQEGLWQFNPSREGGQCFWKGTGQERCSGAAPTASRFCPCMQPRLRPRSRPRKPGPTKCSQKLQAVATCFFATCYAWRGPTECRSNHCHCQSGYCADSDKSRCEKAYYKLGTFGTNVCPTGSFSITSATACKRAAALLGSIWGSEESTAFQPKGCYEYSNGYTYYNSHATGGVRSSSQPICTPASEPDVADKRSKRTRQGLYVRMLANTNACASGTSDITDATTCESAATSLGHSYATLGGSTDISTYPKGCFWEVQTSTMYFNDHSGGNSMEGRAPICVRSSTSPLTELPMVPLTQLPTPSPTESPTQFPAVSPTAVNSVTDLVPEQVSDVPQQGFATASV